MSVPPFVQLAQDVIEGNKSHEDAEKRIAFLLIQGQLDFDDLLALWHKGMHKHAIICLSLLKKVFIKSDNLPYAAETSLYLGFIHRDLGEYDSAENNFRYAQKVFTDDRNDIFLAKCDANIASLYHSRGLFEEAIKRWESAKNKFLAQDSSFLDALGCDCNLASAYTKIGRFDIARNIYKSIDKQYKIVKSSPSLLKELSDNNNVLDIEIAHCNFNMAEIEFHEDFYDKALELYTKARTAYDDNNKHVDVAKCDLNMAMIEAQTGRHDVALSKYRDAKILFDKSKMVVAAAQCDMHAAMSLMRLGEIKKALKFCQLARDVFYSKGIYDNVAHCDFNAAGIYKMQGDEKLALTLLQSAQDYYSRHGRIKDITHCDLLLASIYSDHGDYTTAFNLYNKVLNICEDEPDTKSICLAGLGNIYMHQENTSDACIFYKDAIEQIETIREKISNRDMRSSFLETKRFIYQDMIKCCLKLKDFKKAIEYVERLKSRNLAELIAHKNLLPKFAPEEEKHEYQRLRFRMKALAHQLSKEENHDRSINIKEELEQAERKHDQMVLNFRTKDLQFDPDQRIIVTYEDIKSLINDPDSALIELFPMQDKTVVFVISQHGAIEKSTELIFDYTIYNLYDHINELTEKYEAYKSDGSNSDKLDDWQKALDSILSELYNKLFLRIRSHLDGMHKITLIPYHGFHLLPLHAMHYEDNRKRRYIIDDYQVTFAPSAKILKYCHERRRERNGKVTIAHACPEDQNFIVCAEWETEYIQNLFSGKTQVEVIDEATKKNFIQQGKNAHILHYAGHATSSALILHDDENKKESANYNLEDIFSSLDLPEAYLATLSACETGVTKLGKTDEYIGLTSGLLHAGAATVISSLWNVNDKSTSLLMKKLYEGIKNGKGKAESLRDAQLWLKNPNKKKEHVDMMKEIGGKVPSDLSSPYYWAGFICSGVE